MACTPTPESNRKPVQLITLDPGHFHAALVQKSVYPEVDSIVHVYAPGGPDVKLHLNLIESYNNRDADPTNWNEVVYTGPDFFDQMLKDKAGNVVVLSGNNAKKTEYILRSLQAGFNVLADKPMVINKEDFNNLVTAFETAKEKDVLLYDIMTERYEITTVLQRAFSRIPNVFGTLETGSTDNPAITKESVHHFYKFVSGSVLTRPAWFMDVDQQGEGIVDVTSHLVDLVQWECFPEETLNYKTDVKINTARHWPTEMTLREFSAITKLEQFPDYLGKNVVNDSILQVYSNGEINYQLKNIHARVSVTWRYRAAEATDGTGDTHFSIMRGTRANLIIRQGAEQQYKPKLYIEPITNDEAYATGLKAQLATIQEQYPGVELQAFDKGWEVVIPDHYKEGHEAHFKRVTEHFLEYLKGKNMPSWEVPNMLAKYYTTTQGLEIARGAGTQ